MAPESWPAPFQKLIRVSNKHLLNPLMLRLAGTKFWYASVIRHSGRRSGRQFSTPVVADRVGEELLIPLPYGTRVDWLRNVLAAGRATVVRKGEILNVGSPEIIGAARALPLLSPSRRRTFERAGISQYLLLHIAG